MERRTLCILGALLFTGAATAQQPHFLPTSGSKSLPPDTSSQLLAIAPEGALRGALQVVQWVDSGRIEELWDSASVVTRQAMQKRVFVDGVTNMRERHGAIQGREWVSIRRQRIEGTTTVPAGNYVSVELIAQVAGGKTPKELVTFRQDEDGVLRFSGYVLQ